MIDDAAMFRWLRGLKANQIILSCNENNAANYMSAEEWIDINPEWFSNNTPEEIKEMKDADTIWTLQIYPHTPVGFDVWNGSTLEAVIRGAMAHYGELNQK